MVELVPLNWQWLIVGFRWALNWKTVVILQPLTLGIGKLIYYGVTFEQALRRRASPMFIQGPVWTSGCVVLLSSRIVLLIMMSSVWQEVLQVLCFWQCRGQRSWSTGWWFGTFFMFPYIGKNNPNWLSYFSEGFKPPTSQHVAVCSRMHEIPLQPTSDGQSKSTPKLPNLDLWGQHLAVGCVVQSLGTRSGPGGWESDQIRLGGALYRRRKSRRSIGAGKMMKNASLVMIGYG